MNEVIEKYLGLSLNLYIDGKYTKSSSSSSFDVVDPATEIKIGEIAEATSEEINSSIEISVLFVFGIGIICPEFHSLGYFPSE